MTAHQAGPTASDATGAHPGDLDDAILLQRLNFCRRGLGGCALSFPAALLGVDAAAAWLRRQHGCVTAYTPYEAALAVAQGVSPRQLTLQLNRSDAGLHTGVGRYIVSTAVQARLLADGTSQRVGLLLDRSADLDALVPAVMESAQSDIVGLHHRIGDDSPDPLGVQAIRDAIAEMAWLRRAYGVLVTRVCLDGLDLGSWWDVPRVLGHVGDAFDEAVSSACEHHRFPRPVLSLTPHASSLARRAASTAPRHH